MRINNIENASTVAIIPIARSETRTLRKQRETINENGKVVRHIEHGEVHGEVA